MLEKDIFRKGSTTYYWCSKFFPAEVREDVFKLYSFVRVVDDYVDSVPQQTDKFVAIRSAWNEAKADIFFDTVRRKRDTLDERVLKNVVDVTRNYDCDPAWVDSFLDAMQADIDRRKYKAIADTEWYMYGSAEVVGLIMSRIMGLPEEADAAARKQGRAMQFINFLRDIDEDNGLGRQYLPQEDMEQFGLPDLSKETARMHPEEFKAFMQFELRRYRKWQIEADEGMQYITGKLRAPLQAAVAMYSWTADQIEADPMIVFEKKVKPSKQRVVGMVLDKLARRY